SSPLSSTATTSNSTKRNSPTRSPLLTSSASSRNRPPAALTSFTPVGSNASPSVSSASPSTTRSHGPPRRYWRTRESWAANISPISRALLSLLPTTLPAAPISDSSLLLFPRAFGTVSLRRWGARNSSLSATRLTNGLSPN